MVPPQACATEAPHDHAKAGIVSGVLYGHILEQRMVRTMDVVRLGPHLLAMMEHASRPAVPHPRKLTMEEVLRHIL